MLRNYFFEIYKENRFQLARVRSNINIKHDMMLLQLSHSFDERIKKGNHHLYSFLIRSFLI